MCFDEGREHQEAPTVKTTQIRRQPNAHLLDQIVPRWNLHCSQWSGSELEQLKCFFNSASYLVVAERRVCDFPPLLQLQALNGVPVERSYNNPTQTRQFVHFIDEQIRKGLVDLYNTDFFSVCMDSSTDKVTIDEEMVHVLLLQDNLPVYKFVAVKALANPDAAGTVSAIVSALGIEFEYRDWQCKLVGLSTAGAQSILVYILGLQNDYRMRFLI